MPEVKGIDLAIKEIDSWEKEGSLRSTHADVIQGMLRTAPQAVCV